MKKVLFILALCCLFSATAGADEKELVDYIDPLIGCWTKKEGKSHGLGKTFPGAATPFGLVQLSPDTITGGDNGSGYSRHHDTIEGFSFNHMSGIGWFGDLGNLQVLPTTGALEFTRSGSIDDWAYAARSEFCKESEVAKAGYYSVLLRRYNIKTELTAAPHAGILRFTYPESETSRIQIDLSRRIGMTNIVKNHSEQHVEVVDDHTIQGYMQCSSLDGGWGRGKGQVGYKLHFYVQFSKPIAQYGVWELDQTFPGKDRHTGRNSGFYMDFPTGKGEEVLMKAGISYVSTAGAKANLKHDIPDWDFDGVFQRARALWGKAIEGVSVEGGTEDQKTIFATALYHSFIDPRSASDVDGSYVGADSGIYKAEGFTYRTIFSGWDVYRSQFPLLTILRPDIVNDQVNTFIELAKHRGYLPRWEILNAYSGCMEGEPAVPVIAEAYRKGIRNYDVEKAYAACRQTILGDKREGRALYRATGYWPDSMSRTLENCYADYALAVFARELGKTGDATILDKMAMNYRNIFDPSVNNMRTRDAGGRWVKWTSLVEGVGCTETNPYQQNWFVPHDVQGLIDLMGGTEGFLARLEPFFEKSEGRFSGWNDYYNHANEPVHHVPYLFNYVGKPWLTQKWVRIIMDKAYSTGVKGLCGNEDVGQMSAWYLLSAMGFHPVDPVSGLYLVGSPLFDRVSVRLDPLYHKGRQLTIVARNNSDLNRYVQSLSLNGVPINRAWLTHEEITSGGTLEFVMGPRPNKQWATAPEATPPSLLKGPADG